MNKKWILELADSIEVKYGEETRDRIFGDIESINYNSNSLSDWFKNLIDGLDKLNDREYLISIMVENCPCYYKEAEDDIRQIYSEAKSLEEFVKRLDENGIFNDVIELRGNVMYATKQLWSNVCEQFGGKHYHDGLFSKSCHCFLASCSKEPISDIFCHCCTVGYYSKMFKNALGIDVKVEFVDSVLIGGNGCTAAIYLPFI